MNKAGQSGTPQRRRYMANWRALNRDKLRRYNRLYGRKRRAKKNGAS